MTWIDEFTDVNGTLLDAHVPNGGTDPFVWIKRQNLAQPTWNAQIQTNRLTSTVQTPPRACAYSALMNPSNEFGLFVEADVFVDGVNIDFNGVGCGIAMLANPVTEGGFVAEFSVITFLNQIGISGFSTGPTGQFDPIQVLLPVPALGTYKLRMTFNGARVRIYWDGVEVINQLTTDFTVADFLDMGVRVNNSTKDTGNMTRFEAGGLTALDAEVTECYPDTSIAVADPVVAVGFACPVDPVVSPDLTASVPSHVITLNPDECITDATLVPNPEAIPLTIAVSGVGGGTCAGGLSAWHTLFDPGDLDDTFELSKPGCIILATDYFGDADPFFDPNDICLGLIPPPRVDPDWLDAVIVGSTLTVSVPADPGLSFELHLVRLSITDGLTTVYAWVMWNFPV